MVYIKYSISMFLIGLILIIMNTMRIAFAYDLNNQDWTYKTNPMGENFEVCSNTSDTTGELGAILTAANTWNSVTPRFKFTWGGTSCNSAPVTDAVNQIRWGTNISIFALAETTYWYFESSGNITEVDVVFNDRKTWSTAITTPTFQYDVESVMLHEFGHFLSLDHSTAPAVMQSTFTSGTHRRALTADDKNGIRHIYGGDMPSSGIPVSYTTSGKVGTDSGWDPTSMQLDNNNYWTITCVQNWAKWGQIKWKIPLSQKEILSEIAFNTVLVDWADSDFEVAIQYTDGTSSGWLSVAKGYDSITASELSSTKKVDSILISEGQFGWFQMKIDYIHATKR